MLTSVGQGSLGQPTPSLYPSVSLQPTFVPPVQLPSATPIMSVPSSLPPRMATPRYEPPDLMDRFREEAREIQPQVNQAMNRVTNEAQGFFRWFFGPIRR